VVLARWGRLEGLIVAIAVMGLLSVTWAIPRVGLLEAVIALLAVAALEWGATSFRDSVNVSLAHVVVLVCLVVSGPALAIACSVGVMIPVAYHARSPRILRTAFNGGQIAIAATVGSLVYVGGANALSATFPDAGSLLALAVASVFYTSTNHALVAIPVSITSSESFLGAFRTVAPAVALQIPNVGLTALSAVLLLFVGPWALALMIVPAAIARYALLSFQRVDEAYDRLVRGFVKAIEVKDLYTRGHSERVSMLSVAVASELGVPYDERRLTRYAALLHDVGKIGVPLCIINKPGPLDDGEFDHIKQHPTIGAEILRDIDFLAPAIDIVRYHHERLDGQGYPHGVDGDELSQIVRIVTAVDAFDAMTSTRSYRVAFDVEEAIEELRRCAGRQFDPDVVEALARTIAKIGWEPTVDFASEAELHGQDIPTGTLRERSQREVSG
jgi:putative nucleotidyltransferase with HDIG domain